MKLSSLYFSKKSLWLPIAMMLIIAAMVPIITGEINKVGTYFWVDPERNTSAAQGGQFTIDIKIANAPNSTAWEVYLEFDETILGVVSVTEGNWLKSFGRNTRFYNVSGVTANATGVLGISCVVLGPGSNNGAGLLCTVGFGVKAASGSCKLDLYDTSLVDLNVVRSYYPNNDGFFVVTGTTIHDVAITNIWVNATEVQQDDPVRVNVTILNEGDFTQTVDLKVYAERLTHNPDDMDEVWVGDLGTMDKLPNNFSRVEYLIGQQLGISINAAQSLSYSFIWDTSNVAGETYKICAVVIKTGDDDPDDNVYIGQEVHVISEYDLKIADVEVLTPEVDKSIVVFGLPAENTRVLMGFKNATAGANMTAIAPCKWYNATSMLQRVGYYEWAPLPSTWWALSPFPYSVQFHVDQSNSITHLFHIDKVVYNGQLVPGFGPINQAALGAEQVGMIEVTVKNEGKHAETSSVTVYANASTVGTRSVSLGYWTQSNSTKILYFAWNVTLVSTGVYNINASVAPLGSELAKNQKDNKFVDGTIEVVIYDVAVILVQVLDKCNIAGFFPVVRLRATLKCTGTKLVKVVALFIAIDTVTGAMLVCGQSLGLTVKPNDPTTPEDESITICETMSPFIGWNTLLPGLKAPYPSAVQGRGYVILAMVYPYVGRDDNPNDDANKALGGAPWTLPVVDHDVAAFNGWLGTDGAVTTVKGIELKDLKWNSEFYLRCPVLIDVNVASYAINPLIAPSESADVSLFRRDRSIITMFVQQGPAPISQIKKCTWYTVIAGVTPTVSSWWHIISPSALYSIEFHVDQVSGDDFHIDEVMVSGNITDVILATSVENAVAEKEVLIGTQTVTGLGVMQIMTFFNETGFPAAAGTVNIVDIKPCNWYAYNMSLGGKLWGNLIAGPAVNTWWELKFAAYDYMIFVDQVSKVQPGGVGTPFWYRFHVSKVIYAWTGLAKNVTGYPLPAPVQIAWRMQPKTVSFSMCTGPGTPFTTGGNKTHSVWYHVPMVVHVKLTTATDQDPCDNKYVGYIAFKLRAKWGDVNQDTVVSGADVGKVKLIMSGMPPAPNYYPYTDGIYYLPDVSGEGLVSGADVGKVKLIMSGFGVPPC